MATPILRGLNVKYAIWLTVMIFVCVVTSTIGYGGSISSTCTLDWGFTGNLVTRDLLRASFSPTVRHPEQLKGAYPGIRKTVTVPDEFHGIAPARKQNMAPAKVQVLHIHRQKPLANVQHKTDVFLF